jgi:hypothetical protein
MFCTKLNSLFPTLRVPLSHPSSVSGLNFLKSHNRPHWTHVIHLSISQKMWNMQEARNVLHEVELALFPGHAGGEKCAKM